VRLFHAAAKTHVRFDDPNLVSRAGLVPAMRLAGLVGLEELAAQHVRVSAEVGANAGVKVGSLVAGMVAGADDIDGMDVLRHGAIPATFGGIRAPSTLGSFLRAFSHANVRQPQAVGRRVLGELAVRTPLLPGGEQLAFIDVDSMQKRVFGSAKQGAAFGHTKIASKSLTVRGLNVLAATVATPIAAPVIVAARLRSGNATSVRGAASLVVEAINTAREAGVTGDIVVRGDSAFYAERFVASCRRHGAYFSVTAKMSPKLGRAITAIDDTAWIPSPTPTRCSTSRPGSGSLMPRSLKPPTPWSATAPTAPSTGGSSCTEYALCTHPPPPAAKTSCSSPTATTRCSPTARFSSPRPNHTTAATPSSNTSSPTCSMDP
jgi:hypothetical protein